MPTYEENAKRLLEEVEKLKEKLPKNYRVVDGATLDAKNQAVFYVKRNDKCGLVQEIFLPYPADIFMPYAYVNGVSKVTGRVVARDKKLRNEMKEFADALGYDFEV